MFFGDEHYYDEAEGGQEIQVTTTTAATTTFRKISSALATTTTEAISTVLTSTEPRTTTMAPIITTASSTHYLESTTVPIFQAHLSSTAPGDVTTSILNEIVGVIADPAEHQPTESVFQGGMMPSSLSSGSGSNEDDLSTTDAVVLIAGSFYVMASINRSIRQLYSFACYRSDPRLLELGYLPRSIGSRVWGWAAKAIETVWVPIWFDYQYIRDGAVTIAVNDKFRSLTLEELRPLGEELERQGRLKRSSGDGTENRPTGGEGSGSQDPGRPSQPEPEQ